MLFNVSQFEGESNISKRHLLLIPRDTTFRPTVCMIQARMDAYFLVGCASAPHFRSTESGRGRFLYPEEHSSQNPEK